MASLTLTPRAAAEIHAFLQSEGLAPTTLLRVTIEGSGCCEPQLSLSLERTEPQRTDLVLEAAGLRFLVDSITARHLGESEVDFQSDELGERFLFHTLAPKT